MTDPDNDITLLDETVDVEEPRQVVGGSIASFAVLTVVAVGGGIALIVAIVMYGLPAIQAISELLNSR